MRHLAVVNPHSFFTPEIMRQTVADIEAGFRETCGTKYKIHVSRYPRDAIAVVHRYIASAPDSETVRVYAVGGDGILFECLNGMVDFPNAELTCMPYGNANDVLRAFGEDAPPAFRDVRNLVNAPAHPIDIINCGENYALIEANVGLVGQIIINTGTLFPALPRAWLRKNIGLAYSVCGIQGLFNKEVMRQRYDVLMDGKDVSGQYSNILVSNCPCDGGSLIPSPYSKPNDGQLEVIFAGSCGLLKAMKAVVDYGKGLFEKHPDIYHHTNCKTLEVKSNDVLRVQIDGEGFYAKEARFEIVPSGIKFAAPEGFCFADYSYKAGRRRGHV